ncbi:hypothetical protein LR021_05140, partial [Candidatus Bipolaricaulota bacterium]|nr:hypothetical protein [Candidatus Bipolaricaulota bacterium]
MPGRSDHYLKSEVRKQKSENRSQRSEFLVDLVSPEITVTIPEDRAEYLLNDIVYSDWTAVDVFPGLATAAAADDVNIGMASGEPFYTGSVGLHAFTVTAVDLAGNTTTVTVPYWVVYNVLPRGVAAEVEPIGIFLDKSIAGGGGAVGIAVLEAVYTVGEVIH